MRQPAVPRARPAFQGSCARRFVHLPPPVSGTDYTLQVQELAQETLPRGLLTAFYPTHFTAMRYTLSPAPSEDIRICDCDVGDRPLEIGPCTDAHAPEAQSSAACIGIIGGAGRADRARGRFRAGGQPRCLLRPAL